LWDRWIFFSLLLLFFAGELIILSVNTVPGFMENYSKLNIYKKPLLQFMVFTVALFFATLIARFDYRLYLRGHFPYLISASVVLSLLFVLVKKVLTGRAVERWLLGGSVQPLEFAKISLVLFLSYYIVKKGNLRQWRYLFGALFFPILTALLLLAQPDRGGAVFILALTLLMVYVGGIPKKAYLAVLLLVGPILYIALSSKGYVAERLSAWKDPFADPEDSGYQIIQSLYAFARGGLMGVGIGQGIQKLGPLPASDTDYVMAVVGEELGFLGVLAVALLYSFLVGRLFLHAYRVKEPMGKLILFGTAVNFALSFLWNMAMVSNLIPPKGIALPFLSYGASNLFSSVLFLGIAQSVLNHQQVSSSNLFNTSSAFTPLRQA
jgi:cell division protein FtsW